MEQRQFFTNCRYCKKQILMVRNVQNGRFTPCDPEIHRYIPNPVGDEVYVTAEGITRSGYLTDAMEYDIGYRKHMQTCKARK